MSLYMYLSIVSPNYKFPADQLDDEFIMKLKSKDYKYSSSDVTKLLRIIYTHVSFLFS